MARISGLASDHHPQGPGDAPRRKKGKRAASPTGDTSSGVKRKRVHIDDHDNNNNDVKSSGAASRADTIIHVTSDRRHSEPPATVPLDEHDSQTTPPPLAGRNPRGRPSNARRARMSVPAQLHHHADEEHETGDNRELQFAPLKAIIGGRYQRRLRRSHLSQEVNTIEQHEKEDKKLRKAYTKLKAQLDDKDGMIQHLERQLQARELGTIDMSEDRAKELEQELDQAREEIADLRRSSLYTGASHGPSEFGAGLEYDDDDDDANDGLVLVDPNDEDGPASVEAEPLPNGEFAARALALSQDVTFDSLSSIAHTQYDVLVDPSHVDPATVPDRVSDKAKRRYEGEIERLVKSLAESQGALRVIALELQNINVVAPGASADAIIDTLRRDFETLREEIHNLHPGSTDGLTNSELLHKTPILMEGALAELRSKTLLADKYYRNEQTLRRQWEHVIDLLSRTEENTEKLEQDVRDLHDANEAKQAALVDLQERVDTMNGQLDDQDADMIIKTTEINGLHDEVQDKEATLARLRASLDTYRDDLETLTTTTTRLEEEHRETIAAMEDEHADVVAQLEERLSEEVEGRTVAENDALDKGDYIEELQRSVDRMEGEFDVIKQELDHLRARLAEEAELRQTTEDERDQQADLGYDRAVKIENLEETIRDLEHELAETKAYLDAERSQRQETEEALDTANDEIKKLDDQLRNAGIQANELRSKLFDNQQQKAQMAAELEVLAEEQQAESSALLDEEIQNRHYAEQEVANLKDAVVQLQNEIDTLESDMDDMTNARAQLEKDRDDNVTTLNDQFALLKQKYAALESSSSSTITTLQANITDLTNQVNHQSQEIERIADEANENDRALRDELADKNQQITELTANLSQADNEMDQFKRANKSLSERVEEGAVEILRITDSNAQETASLHDKIALQKSTIDEREKSLQSSRIEHENILAEKNGEIEELRMITDARASHIVDLETQIEQLKEAFLAAEADTRATIDTLTETQRQLQAQNETLADAIKKRNADAVKAVQAMKVKGLEVKTKGVDLRKVADGKISKVSEKVKVGKKGKGRKVISERKWRDSGFGMDEEEENEALGMAEVEEEGLFA
ncbi:hypothetical protein P280DRAFT_468295 [Massarina eburnea CBS 473.64]|uniref:Uncharacterized protein n=1 Tax=Massarina eburnea CBS 473.64 TaxID=1395130 RepID=A0A6A6S366_9PLEO|nr:hypothetical protein P280DRAFT_468295 [Massarina eburnea CBS 473.64]